MPTRLDLKGKVFGRLLVIRADLKRDKSGKIRWICKCSCDCQVSIRASDLRSGKSKSCGCLRRETSCSIHTTHSLSSQPVYAVWNNMKARCNNPKTKDYKGYGGRGIKVCDRWLESFENFYEDMKDGYEKELQIDRIDNDRGYSKENCKWSTRSQNGRNKRTYGASKYRGVSWDNSSAKWKAQVNKEGKAYYLGLFTSEIQAALVYNRKALELFGEYAFLNELEVDCDAQQK